MSLTITTDYFFRNFEEEENMYVGEDIDWVSARNFDFKDHSRILEEIYTLCDGSHLKIGRMKNIVSVCFNVLLEQKRDISQIHLLKDLFKKFIFFKATTSEDEIYYECPCTQPGLHELDWFSVINTDKVFYVGSECVNKFDDENFKTNHKKKLKEQLAQVKIDGLIKQLNTSKEELLHFVRFNYSGVYDCLKNSDTLAKSQLNKLENEIEKNWLSFSRLLNSSNDVVGRYVFERKKIFINYTGFVDEKFQQLFVIILKKRKLTPNHLNALGISGKNILRRVRTN